MAYSEDSGSRTDGDASKEVRSASPGSRYRFRADLQIVRDSSADVAGADVAVVDVRSGVRHIFTADEFRLTRAADGTNTLAAIREAFKTETGREISHGKVFAFFRRLRGLGLLEESGSTGAADQPAAAIAGETPPATNARSTETARQAMAHDDSLMIAAPGLARDTLAPAAETSAGAADVAPLPPVEDTGATASAAASGSARTEPSDSAAAGFGDDRRRARRRRMLQSRLQADKPASAQTLSDAAATAGEARKSGTAVTAKAGESEVTEELAAPAAMGEEFEELLGSLGNPKIRGRTGRPGGRRRRRHVARADEGAPEGPAGLDDADDFAAAFGDEIGAGGARAMFGGGLEGRGLGGGARMQNFLARARARQGAEADADTKEPARVSLFNPNAVLGILAVMTWPLKYLLVPLLLLVPAVAWMTYHQRDLLVQDIKAFDASVVGTIILGLVIANFICRLTQAIFIRSFGAPVKQFGVALTFGVPRFFVDLGGIASLDRRGQLWVHAAPLIARLGLFCAGTLLWFALRQSAPSPAHLALVVGQIGLLAFLLSAQPLLPSDGYRWLAAYFGHAALPSEALGRSSGRVAEMGEEDNDAANGLPAAVFYVLASALAASVLALILQAYFDVATTGNIQALTAVLLLAACAGLAAWVIMLWNDGRGREVVALAPDATQRMLANWSGQADLASDRPVGIGTIGKVLWAVLACVLVAVAFLPYRYNPSGTFEILPTERMVVAARTSGDLEQILVHEGDWVKANQALAKLSSDDQQREIKVTRAELDRAKAQLAQFGGKTAATEDDPAADALNRSIAEAFADDTDSASAKNEATATNYTKTQAERAARADVERLTRKLAYARDQLADTTIRAPKDGRVMTPNVHLLTGIWLRKGAELLSLADTRTLEAQIDVPEADIGSVKVGDKVRMRPWSNEDREIAGTVSEIAPAAQARPYGTIVRVHASIPNEDANMRPAMTGYAKIDGDDMRVWEAFLSRVIRIVRVEMWSWIP